MPPLVLVAILGFILSIGSFAIGIYQLKKPEPHPTAAGRFLIAFGALGAAAAAIWWLLGPTVDTDRAPSTAATIAPDSALSPYKNQHGKSIESLRAEHGVRPLGDLEEDLPLNRLPNGIYGFCWPGFLLNPNQNKLKKRVLSPHYVEVHKLKDGSGVAVGFVGQQTALQLETGTVSGKILVFPQSWEEASTLASVPLKWITAVETRNFREGAVLEFTLMSPEGKNVP